MNVKQFLGPFVQAVLGATLALSLASGSATASSFEEAHAAYTRGDYELAFELARPLAEQGNAGAEILLAQMYRDGRGVTLDQVEAVSWFTKAANQGYAGAQANLGDMYARGIGVAQDNVLAYFWYALSLKQSYGDFDESANQTGLSRQELSRHMTAAEIAEAEQLVTQWQPVVK